MDRATRSAHNERFLQRLMARRPHDREHYEHLLKGPSLHEINYESTQDAEAWSRELVLETIVARERPVLFVKGGGFDTTEVTALGNEAVELTRKVKESAAELGRVLPLIGRFDVTHFPGNEFLGTGWFVDTDIVITNRHVASLVAAHDGRQFVFRRGVGGLMMGSSICIGHEFDDLDPDASRVFAVKEVLYIERESGPNDIAFVRVERRTDGLALPFIPLANANALDDALVCVIGYPARAPRGVIPDQDLMEQLYRGRFDVKRAAPGYSMGTQNGLSAHDCTTLGGNSGSVVLDFRGQAVGLHFAGRYQEANYAVPALVLSEYVRGKRWNQPPGIEQRATPVELKPPAADVKLTAAVDVPPSADAQVVVTIPLTITVSVGAAVVGTGANDAVLPLDVSVSHAGAAAGGLVQDTARVEEAAKSYWDSHPKDVLAARVGYFDEGDRIGDRPCIAVSVKPDRWREFEATAAGEFEGVPIRYLPADVDEQVQSLDLESVDSIAYDDGARTAAKFSFAPVEEVMDVTMHVGPEYSWDELKGFLDGATGELVSAMYEFHARHIEEAIERRLEAGVSLTLVLDNATFSGVKNEDTEFDRVAVFDDWAKRFAFKRVVAPEGSSGLISDSYHIKVTVRKDDTLWLSSGNWRAGSSQPEITPAERDRAAVLDLEGNREWHVIIKSRTLATRFRNHIVQDFKRSTLLGGGPVPARLVRETLVDVPLEETIVLERRRPSKLIEPKTLSRRRVKVRPLLTPDQQGAVYCDAVLELIRSATKSLLFQIPYIAMAPYPRQDRGYIDLLIRELTAKLIALDDARVLLRTGGQKYSSPTAVAWYFKSKGVNINERVRVIENHHTKGMIVDGERILLGSHNWSKPGVTLNRDASLLFDDVLVAAYYAEAFEIDWARSNPVRPRRFVRTEGVVLEALGAAPPAGYERVRLSDLVGDA
jgi:hypothetical protein